MRPLPKKAPPTPAPRRSYWPALLIIAAACAFCWPVFAGRIMSPADMVLLFLPWKNALHSQFPEFHRAYNPMLDPIQQYLPWRMYAVDSLRSGLVPLWNPYSFMGTPFLANLQSTLLYPPNLLFLLTGAAHGFGVSAILHLIVGGLFMFAFLRTLDLRPAAATLGALVFMFNGFTVTWLEYPTLSLWTFMWLPGVLWSYERALRTPRSLWPVLCGVLLAMIFLGGHFQIASYLVMAFLIYAVARAVSYRKESRPLPALALALIPLLFAVALAAGQILPTLELASHSGRVSQGLSGALSTRFPITHLVLYFVPNFFSNPLRTAVPYWGNVQTPAAFNFFETACYAGILPLALAVWGLRRGREFRTWYFAALIVFALLAATGPLYPALYYLAPGFKQLAGLGRILCLAAFGIAGLAAVGMDDLLARTEAATRSRSLLAFALIAAAFSGAALAVFTPIMAEAERYAPGLRHYAFHQIAIAAALLLVSLLLIHLRARLRLSAPAFATAALALVLLDLFGFGITFNPFVDARLAYPRTDSIRWLQEHAGSQRVTSLISSNFSWFPHNASMVFGLRDIHGSDSLRVHRAFEVVSPKGGDQGHYPPLDSPIMDILGVRYCVTELPVSGNWRVAYSNPNEARIYENPDAYPRAYWALPEKDLEEEILRPSPRAGAVRFQEDAKDRQRLAVTATAEGVLVLMDTYYPGWRARVDGKPASIYRVNYAFRGVRVSKGVHTVEFRYEPATYRVGLFISLLALFGLVLFSGASSLLAVARRRGANDAMG